MRYKWVMLLVLSIFLIQLSSSLCTLTPTLINQDPNPAVPSETVKVLFQLEGVENPECGQINLEFLESYPFSLDPGYEKLQTIYGGTYTRDFNSFWMVPYKIRIDKDALDGDHTLQLKTWINNEPVFKITEFNLSIEEVRTEFIVTIDGYSFSTKKLSLGIVNVGKKNAQSITVEIPSQENAAIEGGHVKILGELNSNEDTTATFDAVLSSGPIKVNIEYNDEIGERRVLSKEVIFSEIPFESTREKSSISLSTIFLWIFIVGVVIYLIILRRRINLRHRASIRNATR